MVSTNLRPALDPFTAAACVRSPSLPAAGQSQARSTAQDLAVIAAEAPP
jgi:hypothetical protein